jgi:Domain of unknown function (DUF4062)
VEAKLAIVHRAQPATTPDPAPVPAVEVRQPTVFLSYTTELARYPERRPFVAGAESGVIEARCIPRHMGRFTAQTEGPVEYYTRVLGQADVYLGIIGFRYGSLVPGRSVSHTELEFEIATRLELPRLIFMLDEHESYPIPVDKLFGTKYVVRQERFRQRLTREGPVAAKVADPARLELQVFKALIDLPIARPGGPPRAPRPARTGRGGASSGQITYATQRPPAGGEAWHTGRQGEVDLAIPMVAHSTETWLRARLHRAWLQA